MTDTTLTDATLAPLTDATIEALFLEARTANTFSGEPLGREELDAIWQLVKWPPTMTNIQPLRVQFVTSEEGHARLTPHMSEGNQVKTASAPAVAILAFDTRFHDTIPIVAPHRAPMIDWLENDEATRHTIGRNNAWLQAGYFIMSVRSHGYAAGPMGGFDNAGVDGEFFPDGRWKSILVVNIGKPGQDAYRDRLPRLDSEETARWA